MTESERLVAELRASNAELLAALELSEQWIASQWGRADHVTTREKEDHRDTLRKARAAIAKAVPAPKAKPTTVYYHAPARPWIVTPRMRKTR